MKKGTCEIFKTTFFIEHLWWLLLFRKYLFSQISYFKCFCKMSIQKMDSYLELPRYMEFFNFAFLSQRSQTRQAKNILPLIKPNMLKCNFNVKTAFKVVCKQLEYIKDVITKNVQKREKWSLNFRLSFRWFTLNSPKIISQTNSLNLK